MFSIYAQDPRWKWSKFVARLKFLNVQYSDGESRALFFPDTFPQSWRLDMIPSNSYSNKLYQLAYSPKLQVYVPNFQLVIKTNKTISVLSFRVSKTIAIYDIYEI